MSKPTDKLYQLQDLLVDEFIERIQSGEAQPSDLNAARQLLKDNGIHAQITNENPLGNLVDLLPFQDDAEPIRIASK